MTDRDKKQFEDDMFKYWVSYLKDNAQHFCKNMAGGRPYCTDKSLMSRARLDVAEALVSAEFAVATLKRHLAELEEAVKP